MVANFARGRKAKSTAVASSRLKSLRTVWLNLAMLLALLLNLFPGLLPGAGVPIASAHNLQTKMVYMFLDPDTQAFLDSRIDGSLVEVPPYGGPPNPLLRVGDEVGIIIKVVPRDGTTTGVGGHVTFYVPDGVQVIDAAYLLPGDSAADGITGYDRVPMKGQSLIAVGAGPIGAKATTQLIGLTGTYQNVLGVTEDPVTATGLHRGTIAGVYGDTGIFYSTDPDTSYGSWQRFTGDADEICGVIGADPAITGKSITNNSGDVFVPCNKWDAEQMYAWGVKGTTYAGDGAVGAPIVDYGDGRGNAPWGFASGVAGPQSGYAWNFDWDEWRTNGKDAAAMRGAMSDDEIGPWNRIQYPGSRVSLDQPGLASTVLGVASTDASNLGVAANTLPATTSQTDTTSPKAIRWAVGQLTNLIPEYVWVKIKVNDTAAILNADGCPVFNGDTFGGDAGGTDNGKDHLWRYYEPSRTTWNGCVAIGKPTNLAGVKVGDTFTYNVDFYNLGTQTLTNVVVRDTLPSGVSFVSAIPAQNSGPSPLVWNLGTLQPGQKFSALVTVKATGSGALTNNICVSSDQENQCAEEITTSGAYPLLKQSKSVTPTAVAPGGTVQYTVRIDNIGGGATGSPIQIEEHLDAGITYVGPLVSALLNGANVTANTTVNATDAQNPVFTVPGSIQAGKSLFLTFNAKVAASTEPGEYCNWYTSYAPSIPSSTGSLACITVAGGKIGDTIWRDWDGDGVQDAGEEGIAGVTVKLYESDGVTLITSTTTDANGNYYFPGLTAGTYVVEVNDGSAPAGTTLTGDPDNTDDNRHTVILSTDEQYLTADFGYQPTGSGVIGDTVFEDIANDGLFNGADVGIENVIVSLYEDANGDGVIDPLTDALVMTTTTDVNGNYSFTGLAEGVDYIVYVDPSDSALTTYFGVDPFQASTDNPQAVDNLTGTYNDADFGFWRVEPSSIGDQVFIDNDNDGVYTAGVDTPLAGVTVTLENSSGVTSTVVTGPDGTYLFSNLGPGDYTVVVDTTTAPDNLGAVVSSYNVSLAAGDDFLTADFPFVPFLSKTAEPASVEPGDTITYTLRPFYPGSDLLTDVRIIDPLPFSTTYVAASANAGGTFGAYVPIAAVPGEDLEGGPAGTTTLQSSVTASPSFVNVGGSVAVTVRITSEVNLTGVSPTDFGFDGGAATCTGPTPTSANLTANTGQNFVWSCTLDETGEYIFSASASDTSGDNAWPAASSASVLSAPTGGANVVTWNLGSNTSAIPGEDINSGAPAGIYGFRGRDTQTFSRFGISSGAWTSRADYGFTVQKGGALTTDGVQTIYGLRGDNAQQFRSYDVVNNTWTALANTGVNVNEGGALVFLNVDLSAAPVSIGAGAEDYVYALMGNGTGFRRYRVSTDTWAAAAPVPQTVKWGGALTTDGTYIYATRGDGRKDFYRYDPVANTWSSLAPALQNIKWGGIAYLNGFVYSLRGDDKNEFYRYNVATNTWERMANAPDKANVGSALTTDGTYVYALQGKDRTGFWRYNVATNTWTVLAAYPATVKEGGALVYVPAAAIDAQLNVMSASPALVSDGDTVTVRMTLSADTATTNVQPGTVNVNNTGSASATLLTGPTLVSADDDIAGSSDSVVYEWTYSVTPGANPGSLTFSADATGDGPVTFPHGHSEQCAGQPAAHLPRHRQ